MGFNSRSMSGGSHTSSQPQPRMKKNSADIGNHQYIVSNLDSPLPDDSVRHEKTGQATGLAGGLHKEHIEGEAEEEGQVRKSCTFSTANSRFPAREALAGEAFFNRNSIMSIPMCMASQMSNDSELINHLRHEHIPPPVTITKLQELDLCSFQNNLNLRIDICHDPDLFFQPISGKKGEAKQSEARSYWSALVSEFQIYTHNAQPVCEACRQATPKSEITFRPQLPAFFHNLRDIVQMLVPDSDHEEVINHLDTDFLMQQTQMGVLDAVRLSKWLAKLLTSHCAPMRDCIAAAVVDQIRNGTELADMEIFVQGLEKLCGLLEAMKLDIANHQIRSFRYPLIEGTVDFQRDCFTRAIEAGEFDVTKSQRWYRLECFNHRYECGFQGSNENDQRFECFVHGLVHLCDPNEKIIPLTLQYDQQRIIRLQEDLQDHVQINLCLAVFNQQVREFVGAHCDPTSMHNELKERIIYLAEDDDGNGGAISDYLDTIGVEITRAAYSMRSFNDKVVGAQGDFNVERTVKLLYDVFQYEDEHQTVTKNFLASLEARTIHFTTQFQALTTLEISNTQKTWAQARTGKEMVLAEWDELARKIAHIAVLHWRVWKDLCYDDSTPCNNSDDELVSSASFEHLHEESQEECPIFVQPSLHDHNQESMQATAFQRQMAAIQLIDVHMQRQDSGFAERCEDIDSGQLDLDLELEPDNNKRCSAQGRLNQTGNC